MHKRKARKNYLFKRLFVLCVLFFIIVGSVYYIFDSNVVGAWTIDREIGAIKETEIELNSVNAIYVESDSGTILLDKNSRAKMYPASMTKIMTAIIVLENVNDLDGSVNLRADIFESIYNANAANAGFLPDEKVRIIDLLYGLMLPSGAECAIGLSEYVAGSEKSFVNLMNDKAQKLEMNETHFTNATGLHDEEHYSTVEDISILFRYAIKNSTFFEIVKTSRYSTNSTNLHEEGITFYSTLFSKMSEGDLEKNFILGGKTGYTEEAGQCLASFTRKEGKYYILVTSAAYGDKSMQNLHIDDALAVHSTIRE